MKKPSAPQASVSFFVRGIPTGHGKLKTLDPTIGQTFIDGLRTLAKAGPEQRWKHAVSAAARPLLRDTKLVPPLALELNFVVPTSQWHKLQLLDCAIATKDTLVEIGLLPSAAAGIYTLTLQKHECGVISTEPGCFVRIEPIEL